MLSGEAIPSDTTQGQGNLAKVTPPITLKKGASSPLEFLKNNTNSNLQASVDPDAIAARVREELADAARAAGKDPLESVSTPIAADGTPTNNFPVETPKEVAPAPAPDKETPKQTFEEELLESAATLEPGSIQESYKQLRTKYKETTKALKDRETEFTTVKKKLEDYETGTIISPLLQAKDKELEELKRYKEVINFKASPEYDEKFSKPITEIQTKLKTLTDSYNIPLDEILNAKKVSSEAEFNQFLSEHFDPVGALKVDGFVTQLADLDTRSKDLETNPEKGFNSIKQELARANEVKESERVVKVQTTSKKSWVSVLNKIKSDGKYKHLIYSDTNDEHNTNVVEPLLTHAAHEYGKTISKLIELGIKDFPDDIAEALARGHLYGASSALMTEVAMKAMEETEKIKNNTKDLFRVNRPSTGGTGAQSVSSSAEKPAANPKDAAKEIVAKVLAQRRA